MSADQDVEEDHYATLANFGGDVCPQDCDTSPFVIKVTVPESIKRRVPSKHYVYKVVIEWSNDSTVIIYRRYTHFFDFLVKLQQLVSSLIQRKIIDGPVNLPELPGRVLFGRREVHQVAEKRRRKIEEFCQQLIQLPPEISQSSLVLGFFNTWPDDTLLRSNPSVQPVISNPVLTSPPPKHLSSSPPSQPSPPLPKEESPPPGPFSSADVPQLSPLIISPSMMASSAFSTKSHIEQAIEAVISHPDEMENLEQYRVLDNYDRKDSHQVNLHAGQIVHVIEKHDTGWWMVMSDDEQGYAPAVYLEPVEENNAEKDIYPEGSIDEVYEAMESFSAENEDEVGFRAGERIHVVSKSMDGWWKIRCNGKVGYSPAALIRRKMPSSTQLTSSIGNFESEKFIYEEMNIHRPPPRRNTIDRTALNRVKPVSGGAKPPRGYDSPKSNVALASHFDSDVYVSAAEKIYTNPADDEIYAVPPEDKEDELYAVPPELSDEEDQGQHYMVPRSSLTSYKMNGEAHQGGIQKAGGGKEGSKSGDKSTAGKLEKQVSFTSSGEVAKTAMTAGVKTTGVATSASGSTSSSPRKGSLAEDKAAQSSTGGTKPKRSIYDDTVFDAETLKRQGGKAGDAKEDPDAVYENTNFDQDIPVVTIPVVTIPLKKPPISKISQASKRHKPKKHTPDDYEDLEHFEGKTSTELIPALDDYVDMDGTEHNMYVAKEEFQRRGSDFSPVNSPSNPLSPPASVSSGPQGVKSPMGGASKPTLSKSVSMEVGGTPIMEDDYIEMDPVVPDSPEKAAEPTTPSHASPVKSTKPLRPSPPLRNERKKTPNKSQSSQNVLSKILKKSPLIRAKSMEDILSSSREDYDEIPRQHSPPMEGKTFQPTPPPLPPPRVPGANKRQSGVAIERYTEFTPKTTAAPPKTKSVYTKLGRNQKPSLANGHPPSSSRRSASPPSTQSPTITSPDPAVSPLKQEKTSKGQETPSDTQGKRENLLSRMIERMQTKYIALHSYSSPKEGCLGFSAGELCTVKQKKNDGWWLVRIRDKEGWTPGNYWKEESKSQSNGPAASAVSSTPQKASEARKPRSHTVAIDGLTSPDATSSTECTTISEDAVRSSSLSLSLDGDKSPLSSSMDGSKPMLPSRPPLLAKPKLLKGPPPPRPKPFVPTTTNQGPNVKKPMKPVPPQKPSTSKLAASRSSPGPSSPPERRKKKSVSPPPPPLPPPNQTRKFSSPFDTEVLMPKVNDDEYVMLKDATCMQDIQSAPWFSGKMDRMQAEQFLMEYGRQREFLVRERTAKDGFYALSIRYHYSCKHFNIDPTGDGQFSMGTLTFPNIEEVIRHYQQNSLFIHDGQHVTLGQPAKKKTRGSDASKYNPVH